MFAVIALQIIHVIQHIQFKVQERTFHLQLGVAAVEQTTTFPEVWLQWKLSNMYNNNFKFHVNTYLQATEISEQNIQLYLE